MWTVGRSNFGENDKHPAVMEALERMVDLILKARDATEAAQAAKDASPYVRPRSLCPVVTGCLSLLSFPHSRGHLVDPLPACQGIFGARTSVPLEVIQTDDALHQFSASLLRIPTHAITTIPRDDALSTDNDVETKPATRLPPRSTGASADSALDYGGNWILGNNKGVYLRATNDSFVANDETEDEVTDAEAPGTPFDGESSGAEPGDGDTSEEKSHRDDSDSESDKIRGDKEHDTSSGDTHDQQEKREKRAEEIRVVRAKATAVDGDNDSDSDDDDSSEHDTARLVREKAASDQRNDELAWRFFAGSIGRARTEEILTCVSVM